MYIILGPNSYFLQEYHYWLQVILHFVSAFNSVHEMGQTKERFCYNFNRNITNSITSDPCHVLSGNISFCCGIYDLEFHRSFILQSDKVLY